MVGGQRMEERMQESGSVNWKDGMENPDRWVRGLEWRGWKNMDLWIEGMGWRIWINGMDRRRMEEYGSTG